MYIGDDDSNGTKAKITYEEKKKPDRKTVKTCRQ